MGEAKSLRDPTQFIYQGGWVSEWGLKDGYLYINKNLNNILFVYISTHRGWVGLRVSL